MSPAVFAAVVVVVVVAVVAALEVLAVLSALTLVSGLVPTLAVAAVPRDPAVGPAAGERKGRLEVPMRYCEKRARTCLLVETSMGVSRLRLGMERLGFWARNKESRLRFSAK